MNIMNKLKAGTGLLRHYITGRMIPISVNISLTDRCNFNCRYCDIPKRKTPEMDTEQVKEMVDWLADSGCIRIGWTGGEATLREDLKEIIDYTRKRGITQSLVTNGFGLADRIKDLKNLDFLAFSLDGPEKVHDRTRKKGSYRQLMRSMKAAVETGLDCWSVTVLQKSNCGHVDFIIGKAKEIGFSCFFQPVFDYPMSRHDMDPILPEPKEFRKAIDRIIWHKKKGGPVNTSYKTLERFRGYPHIGRRPKCRAGGLFLYIDVNGDIYPCFGAIGNTAPENFFSPGFDKDKIAAKDCGGCWCHTYIELNGLFSMNPSTIMNIFKITK